MTETTSRQRELLERRESAVPRGAFNVAPIFASRALGAKLWDADGREYIDFCGGIGVLNVGHNHPRVLAAVDRQAKQFLHTAWHVAMYEEYVRLAERLNDLSPTPSPSKTVFFNSGAEAGENAVKIARYYTGRPAVACFERAFHGRTLMGLTMTGKVKPYSAGFGPFAPEVYRLPFEPFFDPPREAADEQVAAAVDQALEHLFHFHVEPEQLACVIMEPVLGEGGFYPAHPAAIRRLRDVCGEHGILFAGDEVQAGFARTGALFACERYGIEPDMLLTAKSLAGGLPLSSVTGPAEIMDAPGVGGIGGTFGGNPVACAAGNAVLDVMQEEDLPGRARSLGERVMKVFHRLESEHAHVGDARGLGAMCGLEIVDPDTGGADPERAKRICSKALEDGLLIMTASGNVLRTLMPLVISDEDCDRALEILSGAVASAA